MKNPKLFIFFTLIIGFPLFSFAQTIKQFNGLFDVISVKSSGANYEIVGTFSDLSGVFTATGVMVGDQIVDVLGNAFEIVTVTSISGAKISTISSSLNGAFPSGGSGIIYRPSVNGYPLITNSTPPAVLNTVMNTVTLSVNTDLPSFQSGETLPSAGYNNGAVVKLASNSQLYRLGSAGWTQITSAIPTSMATSIVSVAVQPSGNLIYLVRKVTYYVSDGTAWSEVPVISELPSINKFGDVYYETDEKKLYMMSTESVDGSSAQWVDISGGGIPGGGEFDFPTSPKPGDLFFNVDNNTLYMSDVNAMWVEVSTNGSNPTGMINPDIASGFVKEGQLFYNSSEHILYVYNGTDWIPVGNSLANGQIYVGNSSNIATPVSMSGDASLLQTGKITINDQAITNSKLDKSNIPLSGFGNPISNVNMGDGITNYKISNLQNPSALQDAATKAYVDNLFSNPSSSLTLTSGNFFVGSALNKATAVAKSTIPLSGFGNPTANISMNGKLITNLASPSNDADAVNKLYVDSRPIWPINIGLDPGMLLMGNSFGKAGAVETKDISLSAFGAGIADVSLGGFKLTNLADPLSVTDAATKNYVDTKIINASNISLTSGHLLVGDANGIAAVTLKNSIPLSGFGAATADVSMGTSRIVSLGAPIADTDASNKKYVDDLFLNPSNVLSLPAGNLFIGNAFGKAAPSLKSSIPVSGFGKATETIYMGDASTQYNISYLAEPINPKDAATKNYVDTKIANPGSITLATDNILVGNVANQAEAIAKSAISLSDFGAVNVNLSLENYKITNLADPVNDLDAVNKRYITTQLSSVNSLLSLPTGQLFMGNASGKATAVAKNTIPVSNFGAATANLIMGNGSTNNKITNLADPTDAQDAATKDYVDEHGILHTASYPTNPKTGQVIYLTIANHLYFYNGSRWSIISDWLKQGSMFVGDAEDQAMSTNKNAIPISGFGAAEADVAFGNYRITNLRDPVLAQDAATKKYVDDLSASSGTSALADGKIFVGNVSGVATPVSLSGDVTIDNTGKISITDDAVSAAKLNADVAGSGLKQNGSGALEVDVTTIPGGSISSSDLLITGGSNAALTNVAISIPDKAITDPKLDKANIPLSGFGVPTADLSAGSFKITNLSDPTVDQDATTKKYVDGLVAGVNSVFSLPKGNMLVGDDSGKAASTAKSAITLSGFKEAEANISMGSGSNNYKIINLADPSGDQDAATKKYVDSKASGLTTGTTPPVSPKVGSTYYNTTEKVFYVYDGTQWVPVDNKLTSGQLYVGDATNKAISTPQSALSLSGFGVPTANLSVGSFKITNLVDPTDAQDAATKKYVDDLSASSGTSALADGKIFVGNVAGVATPVSLSGDATIDNTGKMVIADDAISAAKLNANVAGSGLKQDVSGALEVDVTTISGGSISSPDLLVIGGSNAALADVAISIPDKAITEAKLDKTNIPLSGFAAAGADIQLGDGTNNFKISNLLDPTADQDATTKKYVDSKTAGLTTGTTPPVSPKVGSTYYNTTEKVFYVYDGTQWVPVDNKLTSGQLYVGDASNIARATAQGTLSLSGFGAPTTDLSAGSFKITNLSDPTADQDASTKKYVDGLVAGVTSVFSLPKGNMLVGDDSGKAASTAKSAITLSGFKEAEAHISMGSGSNNYKIINLADPSGDQDAATKKYVDNTAAALKDNLGNHTATEALKMGSYSVSNDGDAGDGVAFDTDGHATFGKDVTVNGNFYTPSDKRLKTDIETLTNVLEKIDRLRGVQFEYKNQKKYATGSKIGLIAQELQLVYPEMVTQGEDGYLKVDYTQLTAVLIQAVKEQQMQINMLKTEMAKLQEQINEILQKIK